LDEPCALCHSPKGWTPARIDKRFDHSKSGFPLRGAHATARCLSCHATLAFRGAEHNCGACHEDIHHGELGTDCARCHTERSFLDRSTMFRLHDLTDLPLRGAHVALDCESCHPETSPGSLRFVGKSAECSSCHMEAYRSASAPDHVAGGFPLSCESCHSSLSWSGASFDHRATGFPLTGAHLAAPCASCHSSGVYNGLNTACVGCHQSDYDATTDPGHAAAGFPTSCGDCHGTATWSGATFDHRGTAFPLTGAHLTAACASCHASGVYDGLNAACIGCHQSDYNGTTDPGHAAAGFPTTCGDCHGTATWAGATFDHDTRNFPIYSGGHASRWSACSDCHTSPANFSIFTCLLCHPHSDRVKTDESHQGEAGYQYDSQACYVCHPRGTH
jgi:hypothetical protein